MANNDESKFPLSSPWVMFYKRLFRIFKHDSEIRFVFNNEDPSIKIYVDNLDKAAALEKLIPNEVEFGNVTLKIDVIPPNMEEMDEASLIARAFKNNDIFIEIRRNEVPSGEINYAVFEPVILSYAADDIHDVNGFRHIIASDAIEDALVPLHNVFICSETNDWEAMM